MQIYQLASFVDAHSYYQMRGRTRKLAYENIPDLCAAARELSFESHRFQESLTSIVQSACGIEEEKGLLELRTAEYLSVSPIEWAKEMDELYSLLGPKSFLMGKVAECANNQMAIDVLLRSPRPAAYRSACSTSSPSPAATSRGWWRGCVARPRAASACGRGSGCGSQ